MGAPLDVWAAVPAKSVFGNFGVVRIGGAVLVRKEDVYKRQVLFSVYVGRENRQLIPAARESFFALREAVGTKEPS